MDIEIKKMDDKQFIGIFTGVEIGEMNSLRRTLVADLPKLAIEEVELHLGSIRDEEGNEYESVTALFDEIIAHRLGLLPIPTEIVKDSATGRLSAAMNRRQECDCEGEGCPNCTVMFTLNKKGPATVYSGDLEPLGDAKYTIKEDLIPVVKLTKRQALLIYATAVMGTGAEHAKYQVTTACGYKYWPKVTFDQANCGNFELYADLFPEGLFTISGGKAKMNEDFLEKLIVETDIIETLYYEESIKKFFNIEYDDTKFVLRFETDGSIAPRECMILSLQMLEDKFTDFRDSISDLD